MKWVIPTGTLVTITWVKWVNRNRVHMFHTQQTTIEWIVTRDDALRKTNKLYFRLKEVPQIHIVSVDILDIRTIL